MALLSHSRGFILPITLWLIAAIGLVAAVLSEWVSEAVTNAIALQDKAETEIALANIKNEIAFAFGRRPSSYLGLEVGVFEATIGSSLNSIMTADFASDLTIMMDGRPYVVDSNDRYVVKINDGRGLINLNTINLPEIERLLEVLGISSDLSQPLTDTLRDYRDEDDFERLSGAEKKDYERLGLPPPSDAKLMTPWEARRAIGWANLSELWNAEQTAPLLTTCQVSGFNPNTAPLQALATYLEGVSLESAEAMLKAREALPFRNIRNVGDAAGTILTVQPFSFSFKPSTCLIVELYDRQTKQRTRFSMSLLPSAKSQPWQIDYVLRIPETPDRQMAGIDQSRRFPSPEEIARRSEEAGDAAGI